MANAGRFSGLHVVTEFDGKNGRWVATFEEHGFRYLGLGPMEGEAAEDLWRDRDDRDGIKPHEPPADWVHEDQLEDPVYMMNHQAEAARAIRQGRVRYGAGLGPSRPPSFRSS